MSLGIMEITLILVVILILFGSKRIPELAKAIGKAQYEYDRAKEFIKNEENLIKEEIEGKPTEYQIKDDIQNPEI